MLDDVKHALESLAQAVDASPSPAVLRRSTRQQIPSYTRHSVRGTEFNLAERRYLDGADLHQIRMRLYEHIRVAADIPLDTPKAIVYGFEYLALLWNIDLHPGLVVRLVAAILSKNCLDANVSLAEGLVNVRGVINGKVEVLQFRLDQDKETPSAFVDRALHVFKPSIARVGGY